jgi:hypothetical protein
MRESKRGQRRLCRPGYALMSGGANNNRLTSMTYPNGEVPNYNYACFPVHAKCQVGMSVAHRRVGAVISGSRLAKVRAPVPRTEPLAMNAVQCR